MENHLKKYRLIKEYPGSPKLGEIWHGNVNLRGLTSSEIDGELEMNHKISKYPEFWEEVVGKEYEILSYQSKNKIIAPATNFAIEISKPGHWNIHSVKRLSDREVFTIGDKVKEGIIVSIIIKKDKIYLEI